MNDNNILKKEPPALSRRLMAVAGMVDKGSRIADIGTDHGFVPIYLLIAGIAEHAVAMDVRKGPLDRAREHVAVYGLENRIQTRLSDGLAELQPGEADTMICAGMGGPLMQQIIEKGDPRSKGIKTLILEPQSEILEFRRFLRENCYEIIAEDFLEEDGKYYPVIKAVVCEASSIKQFSEFIPATYTKTIKKLQEVNALRDSLPMHAGMISSEAVRICDRFGPCNLLAGNADFARYLVHGREVCDTILSKISPQSESQKQRYLQIIEEKTDINAAAIMLKSIKGEPL